MVTYLDANTPATLEKEMPPVDPHIIAMMEESERKYQEHIRTSQELFDSE